MGMNLQSVLDPLLTKLWESAETKFREEVKLGIAPVAMDPVGGVPLPGAVERGLQQLGGDLSSLVTRFRGYYSLDLYDLDPLADRFAEQSDQWEPPTGSSVYCNVATAADGVDDVGKLVHFEQWQGRAATAFHDNFLVPFKGTAVVHGACARELAIAAKSLAQAVQRVKESVVWICENAIMLLGGGGDPGPRPGEEGEGGVRHAAGFAAILADTVALFKALVAPEIELLDAALAAIGTGGGLIAESKGASKEESIWFDGNFSWLLPQNVWHALDALDKNIAGLDEQISRGLEKDLSSSGSFGSSHARMTDPHLSSSAYQHSEIARGRDDAKDVIVVSIVRLYYAGYRTLPAASWNYDAGATVCAGAHITGAQAQFPRAVNKFNEAAATFRGLLSKVRDELIASGEAMVTAAKNYQDADEYEAGQIRKIMSQIPAPGDIEGNEQFTPPGWLNP